MTINTKDEEDDAMMNELMMNSSSSNFRQDGTEEMDSSNKNLLWNNKSDDLLLLSSSSSSSNSHNGTLFDATNFTNNTIIDGATSNSTAVSATAKVAFVWSSFLFLVFFFKGGPTIPVETALAVQQRRERQLRREREQAKKDPDRRKRVVEASLITKRVISCDEHKTLRLGDISGSVVSESSFSLKSIDDENVSQCVICIDTFQRGDHVTWSKSMDCRHVFHEECLMGWLSNPKHDDCPACRCEIIHDDGYSLGDDNEYHLDDTELGSSSLAFVIMNGLISPLQRARDSIIGSSIDLEDDNDNAIMLDDSSCSGYSLRRVLSAGGGPTRASTTIERVLSAGGGPTRGSTAIENQRPSMIGVALRRVSSGIYSRLNAGSTLDDSHNDDDDDDEEAVAPSPQAIPFRRTRSEGLPTTPKISNSSSYMDLDRSDSNLSSHLHLDLDDMSSDLGDNNYGAPRRPGGILRLRRHQYAELDASFVEDSFDDDDASFEPQILWRDEVEDCGDLEMGAIEISSPRAS